MTADTPAPSGEPMRDTASVQDRGGHPLPATPEPAVHQEPAVRRPEEPEARPVRETERQETPSDE